MTCAVKQDYISQNSQRAHPPALFVTVEPIREPTLILTPLSFASEQCIIGQESTPKIDSYYESLVSELFRHLTRN